MSILKEVCDEMDALVLDFFDTLDDIYQKQSQLENDIKDGHFLIAKARYSMGVKSISSLQYNEDDLTQAMYHVDIAPSSSSKDPAFNFQLTQPSLATHRDSDRTGGGSEVEGLRQRKPQTPTDLSPDVETLSSDEDGFQLVQKKTPKDKEEEEDTSPQNSVVSSRKDPIKWFGVLVPQALRQSQDRFKRAVQLSCTIATLQSHLLQIKAQFRELHNKKTTLLNDIPNFDDDKELGDSPLFVDKHPSPTIEDSALFKNED